MTTPSNEGGHTLADKMPLHDFTGADGRPRRSQASVVGIEKWHGVLHSFSQGAEPHDGPLMRVIRKGMPDDRTP